MTRIKLKLEEQCWAEDADGHEYMKSFNQLSLDLSKWNTFKEKNDFAAGYVEDIINAALAGKTRRHESRKYTFSDMETSYADLYTSEADSVFDKVISMIVTFN